MSTSIIRRGQRPEEKTLVATCRKCGCKYRVTHQDVSTGKDWACPEFWCDGYGRLGEKQRPAYLKALGSLLRRDKQGGLPIPHENDGGD